MVRFYKTLFIFVIFSLLFLNAGCQRSVDDSNGVPLQLELPPTKQKFQSQSHASLTRVSVQITGAGINPPVFRVFEKCRECTNAQLAGSFEILVPAGTSRLIQVVAVYEDPSTQSMDITYGDSLVNLKSGDNSVSISVTSIAANTRLGKLTGRYLTSPTSGPTDRVGGFYNPVGKPAVQVIATEIINGWFDFIVLENLNITYKLMGSGATLLTNTDFASLSQLASSRFMRVDVPPHYMVFSHHNGSGFVPYQSIAWSGPDSYFMGFIGPAADSSFQICRPSYDYASLPWRNFDLDGDAMGSLGDIQYRFCPDANCTQSLFYHAVNTDATHIRLISGGVDPSPNCADANQILSTRLNFRPDMFGERKNSHLQFYGPFRIFEAGSGLPAPVYLKTNYQVSSQELSLEWNYIPSVIGSGIDGVEILYKKATSVAEERLLEMSEGWDCSAALKRGYTRSGFTTGSQWTVSGIHHSEVQGLSVLVCPVRTLSGVKSYFSSAIVADLRNYNVGVSPLQVVTHQLLVDQATPIDLIHLTQYGVPPIQFSLQSGSGTVSTSGLFTPSAGINVVQIQDADSTQFVVTLYSVAATTTFDFTSSMPSGFSLTRASSAQVHNSDGILTIVGNDVPRFDFDPSDCANPSPPRNCAPLGLLVENASQNNFIYSQDFAQAYWNAFAFDPDILTTTALAPDGTATATQIEDTNKDMFNADKLMVSGFACTPGRRYVMSLYVKKGTSTHMNMSMQEAAVANADLFFNFDTGVATSYSPHGVKALPNGWFRIWVARTCTSSNSLIAWVGPASGATGFDSSATGSSYVWGAQMEVDKGEYPTSYIPTNGTMASRSDDLLVGPSSSMLFSSLTQGSFLMEFKTDGSPIAGAGHLLLVDQTTAGTGDRFSVKGKPGGGWTFDVTQSGVPVTQFDLPGASSASGIEMLGFSFQSGLFQAALNGISTQVVTSYSAPATPAIFRLGRGIDGARSLDGHLIKMKYWPQTIGLPALKGMTE